MGRELQNQNSAIKNVLRGGCIVSCREFANFIAEYLSNELPTDIRAQFEHHLEICTNCVKYLEGYKAAVALGKAAFDGRDEPVPADVPNDLVKAILAARR